MLATQAPRPIEQRKTGTHDCGANYGYCGEHTTFKATFDCPECGHVFKVDMCSAWPVQQLDCRSCFARIEVTLDQRRTKTALR